MKNSRNPKFWLDMIEQILQNICIPDYQECKRISIGNTSNRLQ